MKENFYSYLESLDFFTEDVIEGINQFLDEIPEAVEMAKKENETSVDFLDRKISIEEIKENKKYIQKQQKNIESLLKFREFLLTEKKEYDEEIEYDEIKSIPAYLDKKGEIKVLDLVDSFDALLKQVIANIEMSFDVSLGNFDPHKDNLIPEANFAMEMNKQGADLTDKANMQWYVHFISVYVDTEYLKKIIEGEIEYILS